MDPNTPQLTPAQPAATTSVKRPVVPKRDPKFIWGLICLIGPTALIVASILAYAIANFIGSTATGSEAFNTSPPLIARIINVILFLVGAVSAISWLPGVIAGIVLLATRKK